MQNTNNKLFASKFLLLNSQECSEEIVWSPSDSDYEDNSEINSSFRCRKRKRVKALTNISNLDVTIIDLPNERNVRMKSPILSFKTSKSKSPILTHIPRQNISPGNSPILNNRSNRCQFQKSPILNSRENSPNVNKAKKMLFNCSALDSCSNQSKNVDAKNVRTREMQNEINNSEKPSSSSHAKLSLVQSLQTFFNSHFSSSNPSQNSVTSISDTSTTTEATKTSEEFEIFTCNTPIDHSSPPRCNDEAETIECVEKQKKMRYKKNGLSYRLSALLKKHNANISLWQHERYLAENSNFIVPKMEHVVFHIQKVHYKYGCHLLEGLNEYGDNYTILINNSYVTNNIQIGSIFKLFKPFKVFELSSNFRLITNVFKFECKLLASTHKGKE